MEKRNLVKNSRSKSIIIKTDFCIKKGKGVFTLE